jgi:hypothetical protein
MNTKSPHTTRSTSSNPTDITSHMRDRQVGTDRPAPAVQPRVHAGRFDSGMATYPGKTLDRIGRFDTGMATHPDHTLDRIGRFDTGMATHPENALARIGRFDTGMSQRSTTDEVGAPVEDALVGNALAA